MENNMLDKKVITYTYQKLFSMTNLQCCVFLFIDEKLYYTFCSQAIKQTEGEILHFYNIHELKRKTMNDVFLFDLDLRLIYVEEVKKILLKYQRKQKIKSLLCENL